MLPKLVAEGACHSVCRQETVPPGQVTTNLAFSPADGTAFLPGLGVGSSISLARLSTTSLDIVAPPIAGSPTLVCTSQSGIKSYYNGLFTAISFSGFICYNRFDFILNPSTPAGTPAFGQGFLGTVAAVLLKSQSSPCSLTLTFST